MRWRSLLTLALAAGAATPLAAQETRPLVAVLPFDNGGSYGQDAEDFRALEIGLQQMLITELGVNPNIRAVDRSRIKASLAKQDLATSGRVDTQTAARLGKIVGARYVVAGSFVDFYGDFRLDARIIDVETSEVITTEKVRDKRENLYALVVSLAGPITRGVNVPPLPRQAMEQRQRRNVPAEAVRLYTKALLYEDRGQTARAADLFHQAKQVYPQYTEVDEALKRIGRG